MNQEDKEKIVVCGVNSDIQLEGIELSIVDFFYSSKDQWSMNEKYFKKFAYPEELRKKIITTIKEYSKKNQEKYDDKLYIELETEYGDFINQILKEVENEIRSNSVTLYAFNTLLIQLIENDGQKPKSAVFLSKFCQQIANQYKQRVICNFFAYDFYLKGNGGPFQIIGQAKLLEQQDALLNLSGFASYTQYKNKEEQDTYFGDFICPAMFALNYASNWKKEVQNQAFQDKQINEEFLKQLKSSDKFKYTILSLGNLMDLIDRQQTTPVVKVATLKQYICQEIQSYLSNIKQQGKVFVGGTFSEELFKYLQQEIKQIELQKSQDYEKIDSFIVGFMAVRKNKQLLNVFKGVTKATSDHCSGIIYIETDKPITILKQPEVKKPPQVQKQRLDHSEDFDIELQFSDQVQNIKSYQTKSQNKK
ncbi:unnamed protein product (macronuclear) [Paramecium tetraurelia]|uniref:Uncharacterized protein n=1 Tax=Paramecium tetraurelia TaxID=5888 RepID=A0D4B7_PARTE|nr:uncharacterized protein GSPATT00013350001 [Paramecium tetraurelia]CAK77884.1 unnamed protein product [Paramecium tetraurelia]|eukprot:XP_001445281.1 hypothetical protein (macronuclear) [Paramecium tetraurelia strain d4-2]